MHFSNNSGTRSKEGIATVSIMFSFAIPSVKLMHRFQRIFCLIAMQSYAGCPTPNTIRAT